MWSRTRGRHNNRGRNSFRGKWNGKNRSPGNFSGFCNEKQRETDKAENSTWQPHQAREIEKLHEVDIGVTEFISDLEGFTGVLKSRYSDFHVNEIDLDGQIAKLTDLQAPKDPEPEKVEEDDDVVVNRYRIEQIPTDTWDKIHRMIQLKISNEIVEIDVTTMTKEDRTKIHEAVKTVFGHKIVGSTVTKLDKKFITFKLYNKNDRVDVRTKWPKSRAGEYVYFLVYKESMDTLEANIQISEALKIRPSNFCYAGVKDRRAKTTQWFCVRKVDPTRIVQRTKYLKNLHVGNFCYKKETMKLGQLKGNRFRIALRNVTADDEVINTAMKSLQETGFINYYGLQRFGNCKDIPTHQIGIQLLKGNWKEAVDLILKPRVHEQDKHIAEAKILYLKTRDVGRAFGKLEKNRNRCIEGRLLGGLMKNGDNDFVNALENVPRNMRLLYIHAYQSLVWNRVVSKRINTFGLKPIVGDIVVEGELDENLETSDNNVDDNDGESNEATATESIEKDEPQDRPQKIKVKILTENDLSSYTIYDIVLPLPGYDITYPENEIKNWYREILAEEELSLEMPKQRVKTYTLSGTYRKMIERTSNLTWSTMFYNDCYANLIQSDFDELMKRAEPKTIPDGKHKALIIDMCLNSSSYATMALREVMKMDTSVETHMKFSNQFTNSLSTTDNKKTDEIASEEQQGKINNEENQQNTEQNIIIMKEISIKEEIASEQQQRKIDNEEIQQNTEQNIIIKEEISIKEEIVEQNIIIKKEISIKEEIVSENENELEKSNEKRKLEVENTDYETVLKRVKTEI